jgi:hypothetical protein
MEIETLLKDSWEIFQKNLVAYIIGALINDLWINNSYNIRPIGLWPCPHGCKGSERRDRRIVTSLQGSSQISSYRAGYCSL